MSEILVGSGVMVALVLILSLGLLVARRAWLPRGASHVVVNGGDPIIAQRGETLLSTLHGADIPIPAGCGGSGTCGLCRVEATGPGCNAVQPTETSLLSAAERRAHTRLACQVVLGGDVDVTVPGDILAAETFACEVVSNRMMAPLIRELVLRPVEPRGIALRAGGFMQLTAPPYALDFAEMEVDAAHALAWDHAGWHHLTARSEEPTTRAYSVANRPEDEGTLVFNIRLAVPPAGREDEIRPGIVSSWLFARAPGDMLDVSGPFGEFHVRDTANDIVLVGGGVGMAPLRAIAHEQIAAGGDRRITYFYGARTVADLYYVEEFEGMAAAHPRFDWVPALSDPAPGDRWQGPTGFIHTVLERHLARHPAPETCEFYLCGPPLMISAVLATLRRLGVERQMIYYDDFGG
ncbi:NADH:ubiquinone reductase (Na(+)-transporting) subunit F [Maritimibacter sp. DP07]|uniref:Na(+)-translocating NADH-quinone reductase subunit F n=1 Tax=Maritimibacter harenae TaxID=2606218 RepID=A0A845M9X0_9RHOB|nr:NADH:ubiquinone reductase (Na(+)-transporting) subunit F [Maritimibacter harenae]MZR14977.1 NADH:ubiquinone reductase (Na(+)-transporting) subunit F [Maritimibacter harenae]